MDRISQFTHASKGVTINGMSFILQTEDLEIPGVRSVCTSYATAYANAIKRRGNPDQLIDTFDDIVKKADDIYDRYKNSQKPGERRVARTMNSISQMSKNKIRDYEAKARKEYAQDG